MKKRTSILLLCFIMIISMTSVSWAGTKDLIYTKDATLNASFVKYNNIIVKSGANVLVTPQSGFEVTGSIIVEPNATFACTAVGNGEFNFQMRSKDAEITGIDIYYKLADNNGNITVKTVPGGYKAVSTLDIWDFQGGWCPKFKWEPSVSGWCLTQVLNGNPFNETIYHSLEDMEKAHQMANELNRLGLFNGTGTDAAGNPIYELNRRASRTEGMVMLIRLLGAEDEVLSKNWSHPFTDVPKWADEYIGYAYENGLTTGTTETLFGTGDVNMQMYLTFVIRALGYSDSDTASSIWNEAFSLGESLGMIYHDSGTYQLCNDDFLRADMAVISHRALDCRTADGISLRNQLGI